MSIGSTPRKAEAGGSQIQGLPGLLNKLKDSLGKLSRAGVFSRAVEVPGSPGTSAEMCAAFIYLGWVYVAAANF